MVICLERGADLHMAQLMPLPLTLSCSSKIQIGFTFLVPAYPGCPGKEAVKWLLYSCHTTLNTFIFLQLIAVQVSMLHDSEQKQVCQVCVKISTQLPPKASSI